MRIKKHDLYRTAMYLRLSFGDDDRGVNKVDSNGIANQRLLIEN